MLYDHVTIGKVADSLNNKNDNLYANRYKISFYVLDEDLPYAEY